MTEWQGLWSYVHPDDQADGGRVSRLARDVTDQFQMLTGEKINLFLDADALKWGEDWRAKIDDSLSSIAFFIAVLTPRYFMSAECRRELQFFARRATSLGIKELVLPLLYVDVPRIHDASSPDDLMALVRTFHWEDWRDLRFMDTASEGYRRGVARLAARLVDANKQAETAVVVPPTIAGDVTSKDDTDNAPGLIDRMAAAEEALPKWQEALQSLKSSIESIGQVMTEAKADVDRADAQSKGFAGRLVVARRVAGKLKEPVDRIWSDSNEFASQLHQVDDGLRALIEQAAAEVQGAPDSRPAVCEFFETIRQLSASAHEVLESVRQMIESIAPVESMSRDLRPPLRRLREGLTIMVEAQEVTDEWIQLIERAGVDCSDYSTPAGSAPSA